MISIVMYISSGSISKPKRVCDHLRDITGLPDKVRRAMHVFGHYKDLEHGKWVKLSGAATKARKVVLVTIENHRKREA